MTKFEKLIIAFLTAIILTILYFIILLNNGSINMKMFLGNLTNSAISYSISNTPFQVYQNDKYINKFETYEQALEYAKKYEKSSIKKIGEKNWLYDSVPQFTVYTLGTDWFIPFDSAKDAISYARDKKNSEIVYRKTNDIIWTNRSKQKSSHFIKNVGYVGQYPELYRGCEVTSLTMLLNYKGIKIDKMTLASEIKKDTTPFKTVNGEIHYGNPNFGFVGDIYSSKNKGLGVYHKPIYELLKNYVGEYAIDLTGSDFEDLYYYIEKDIPLWIITNTNFKELSQNNFETWATEQGKIKITYKEHSVLVTGYDQNYIYYNDPMYPNKTHKKPKKDFIKAFNQMGKQAVTYYKNK